MKSRTSSRSTILNKKDSGKEKPSSNQPQQDRRNGLLPLIIAENRRVRRVGPRFISYPEQASELVIPRPIPHKRQAIAAVPVRYPKKIHQRTSRINGFFSSRGKMIRIRGYSSSPIPQSPPFRTFSDSSAHFSRTGPSSSNPRSSKTSSFDRSFRSSIFFPIIDSTSKSADACDMAQP